MHPAMDNKAKSATSEVNQRVRASRRCPSRATAAETGTWVDWLGDWADMLRLAKFPSIVAMATQDRQPSRADSVSHHGFTRTVRDRTEADDRRFLRIPAGQNRRNARCDRDPGQINLPKALEYTRKDVHEVRPVGLVRPSKACRDLVIAH